MTTAIAALEERVLQAIKGGDRLVLERLLTDDFVITTAGWLREPAGRTAWLDGLADHTLRQFQVISVDERTIGDAVVALVLSSQQGELRGSAYHHDFRYTDVWIPAAGLGWQLAVRHASLVPDPAL